MKSAKDAAEAMNAAINVEVCHRGGETLLDEGYGARIAKIGEWLYSQPTPGLMLCGGVGTGKTTCLRAIVDLYALKTFTYRGVMVGFKVIDAIELSRMADEQRVRDMKECPMLAIDDLGVENVTVKTYGNELSPVTEILSARYQRQLLTVITTNLTPRQIRERYGDRIADRFNEMMTIITFENGTYRTNGREERKDGR